MFEPLRERSGGVVKAGSKWAAVAAALALLAYGYARWSRPEVVRVIVRAVDRGAVEKVVANTRAGTVEAHRRARLAPAAGGIVDRLCVREGQRVQQGELLVELWCDDLRAQREVARAQLERAFAQCDEARLRAELAEREFARQQQLLDEGASTGERFDRASIEAQSARAQERASHAEAKVRESEVAACDAHLARMQVRAPFAGVVAEVNGEVGEFATPSPVGVATLPSVDLVDDSASYVTAPIDEVDAALVRIGQPVRIALDAFAGRTFAGCVRRIAPYVLDREKQARTVDVEVDFDAPAEAASLLVGYSADVEIVVARREEVLRAPVEAVRDGVAFVLRDDGTLELRSVEVGIADWQRAEVVEGLRDGERVVVSRDRKGVVAGAKVAVDDEGGGSP